MKLRPEVFQRHKLFGKPGIAVCRVHTKFQQQALEFLRSDRINLALAVDREPQGLRDRYGQNPFGNSVLTARRLIEAGARFVTVGLGDWDTHANNFTRLRTSLLPQLDAGLTALIVDLCDRGLLDETIVVYLGEFGRTPSVNAAAGRDHWARTMTALVAGGKFGRGVVHGGSDEHGTEPTEFPCSPDDLCATLFSQLGFAPEHHVMNRAGRPMPLFRNGRQRDELLAKAGNP